MLTEAATGYRLSPQQKRLWSLSEAGGALCARCAILLEGDLDEERLRRSLVGVVRRHGALRTALHRPPGMKVPTQVVLDQPVVSWRLAAAAPGPEGEAGWIEELLRQEGRQDLDLAAGPCVRATLLELAPRRRLLVLSLTASVADARTLENLAAEVARAYAAAAGEEPDGEVFQYLQFAEWQNGLLEEEDAEAGREFWRRRAPQQMPPGTLPFERPRREVPGALEALWCSANPGLPARLEQAAAGCGVSLEAVLLGAWMVALCRMRCEDEVVVGRVVHGRDFDLLENACGPFSHCLPAYAACSFAEPFTALAQRVDAWLSAGAEWQEYFVADAVPAWFPAGAEPPCFPFGFELRRRPASWHSAGVRFSLLRVFAPPEPFHLAVTCTVGEGGLEVELAWDPARLRAEDAERCAGRYLTLLESVAGSPATPVGSLALLTAEERRLVLEPLDAPMPDIPAACCHELFERQATALPDRVAVVAGEVRLTYGGLWRRALALAARLRRLGVGPEVAVGVCAERSPEMVVGLLAVLAAGGAYVPLDPALPGERLRQMVEEVEATVVLCQSRLRGLLAPVVAASVRLLDIDSPEREGDGEDAPAPAAGTVPGNLAYVLFTSGSTGRPKGVAVEHRQLVNYVHAVLGPLSLEAGAAWGMVSTFGADLGNTVLFGALLTGGTLHVASQDEAFSAEALGGAFGRDPVDCLKIVPSHLNGLLQSPAGAAALPWRVLVLGGEAASWELVERVRELRPGCRILNHYGPTETTVGVTTCAVPAVRPAGLETLPLGRALAGCRLYPLEPNGDLAPVGSPGGLAIGGAGVARGYWGRPDLTAERFLPDPFADRPGARAYDSGDLVRYLPEGDLLFLGRNDEQVKIRGYRVEPREVEVVLSRHPGVGECAILVRRDADGESRLVAFVVPARGAEPALGELRGFLRESLPEPMVPAAFVTLAALPRTPNGKLDRRALAAVEASAPAARAYVAPSSAVEEVLAGIWADVLKVLRVGVEDDFFELGGHSLLAMQIVSRVQESLRTELPLRLLFQHPTVAGVARALLAGERRPGQAERVARAFLRVQGLSAEEVQAMVEGRLAAPVGVSGEPSQ